MKQVKIYCPVCHRVWNLPDLPPTRSKTCVRCSTGMKENVYLEKTPFEMIKEKNVYKS